MTIDATDEVDLTRPPTYFFMAGETNEFDEQYNIYSNLVRNTIKLVH